MDRLLAYFIPEHLRSDIDTYRRARLAVLFPLAGVFAAFYVAPVYGLGYRGGAVLLSAAGALNVLSPWLLRWTGSVGLVGNLLAGTTLVLHTFFVATGGGPATVLTVWLVYAPLIALLLSGKRASLVWAVLVLADIGVLYALSRRGVAFDGPLAGRLPASFAVLLHVGFVASLYVVARLIENGKDDALAVLAAARQEAETMARTLQAQNARIEDQARQLRALDEMKSRFFANISHELRTPLTLILGPLQEALRRGQPSVEMPLADVQVMHRNGQRLLRLVNQMLDLARLEAGTLRLERRRHDLAAFVGREVSLFQSLAAFRSVALAFDAVQMENVANLLSNALKFTPAGGRVRVAVRMAGDAAVLTVEDTGIGIPADRLGRIFERFYQIDDTATRAHEGTGIGLALVKELVELHGGTVDAASTPGAGSTFTVTLPILDAEAEEAAGPAAGVPAETAAAMVAEAGATAPPTIPSRARRPAFAADRTTVLVVEDNADMRAFVRSILADDYRVLEAADGEAGLALAREALPDLVVTDVMMPRLDGIALVRALRADAATDCIPVVALTARASKGDEIEGLEAGADDYVMKPFDRDVLLARVSGLIRQRHRLRERLRGEPPSPPSPPSPACGPVGTRVREVIAARLSDPALTVDDVAGALALSTYQLAARLQAEGDARPRQLIRTMRLERAAELLQQGEHVSEVAYAVGFNSLAYFSASFREHFGITPSAHRLAARSRPEQHVSRPEARKT